MGSRVVEILVILWKFLHKIHEKHNSQDRKFHFFTKHLNWSVLLVLNCGFSIGWFSEIDKKQAGAELAQALIKLELGFTLIKI